MWTMSVMLAPQTMHISMFLMSLSIWIWVRELTKESQLDVALIYLSGLQLIVYGDLRNFFFIFEST